MRAQNRACLLRVVCAVALATAAVAMLPACSGSSPPDGPLPSIESAAAARDVVDGAARLSTVIDVKFDREFTFAPRNLPLASLIEVHVSARGGGDRRVLVDRAERDPDDARAIRVTLKALVPDGAEIRVARRVFHRDEDGDLRAPIASDLSAATLPLASGALVPTDPSMLGPAKPAELKPDDRDPAAQRTALDAYLQKRHVAEDTRQRALSRFDAISADVVPSAKLRAALAALTGTFAEPVIASVGAGGSCTRRPIVSIRFEAPPEGVDSLARVVSGGTGQRALSLNAVLEGERIELIMPLLVREAIHCDRTTGRFEEIAAAAFGSVLYLQLVADFPELPHAGTLAAREANIDAIAMINSGRRLPERVGVLQSEGVTQVLPGTTSPHGSFAALVAGRLPAIDTNDSPDEELAQAYVAGLARDAAMQPASAFNLRYLDELLARALDLRVYVADLGAFALAIPAG